MKHKTTIIKLMIMSILLFIILRTVDIKNVLDVLKRINLIYFLIIYLLWNIGVFLSSLKWQSTLKYYGINLTLFETVKLYYTSSFFNNFLPSSIGGDGYKVLYLNSENYSKAKSITSIILERGMGFSILFPFIFIIGLYYYFTGINNVLFNLIVLSSLIITILLVIFLFFYRKNIKINVFKKPRVFNQIQNKILEIINNIINIDNKKLILKWLMISFVFHIVAVFMQVIVYRAIDYNIDIIIIIFTLALMRVCGVLPISINSIGVSEGVALFIYGTIFGYNTEYILAASIISRVNLLLFSLTGIPFYLIGKKKQIQRS